MRWPNNDLFRNFLRQNSFCDCRSPCEDAMYYFLRFSRFTRHRYSCFQSTHIFHLLAIDNLLLGKENISEEENEYIMIEVQ